VKKGLLGLTRIPDAVRSKDSSDGEFSLYQGYGHAMNCRLGMVRWRLMGEILRGRTAVVTGGGRRLGRAVAMRMALEGADVVVHYRSSEADARSAVGEIEGLGRKAAAIAADLDDVAAISRLFAEIEKRFGRLDLLVNSAANFVHTKFGTTTEEQWSESLDANLRAPFFCSQAAAPMLRKSRGAIINFADVGAFLAWPGYIPHCISKAGVVTLTKCLARDLAPEVRVNAIAPGTVTMAGDPPEWEADFVKRAPLNRTETPKDIEDAVVYLATAESVTGQVLVVDGGRTIAQ
jgi:pteridine reductase